MNALRSRIELRKMISAAIKNIGQIALRIEIISESDSDSSSCTSDANDTRCIELQFFPVRRKASLSDK